MSRFYWFFFALIVVVARVVQLCALYLCNAPTGGPFVADWNRFLWHTMFADIGIIMASAFCLQAVSLAVRGRGLRIVKIVSVVLAGVYLFACGTDDEIMRWMNQRLSFSFIGTYMGAVSDTGLVASIFKEGAFHFLFSFFTVVAAIVGLAFFSRGNRLERAVARPFHKSFVAPVVAILVLAILGCTSHMWFNPSHRRWPRIKPIPYVLVEEALLRWVAIPMPNIRSGIGRAAIPLMRMRWKRRALPHSRTNPSKSVRTSSSSISRACAAGQATCAPGAACGSRTFASLF